jgi:hypothetical protein
MNVGVGASDIVQGIILLTWIWQHGFTRVNSKGMFMMLYRESTPLTRSLDVRYENFRRDVQDFHAVLQDLASALENAARRYRQRGASSALNPLDASFEQERRRLVGAFEVTLQECQAILSRHRIAPVTNAQGVLQSLRWNIGVEDTVNDLRRRLQFHSQKMLLVVNRLSLRLMTDTADKLDDLLGLTEQSIALQVRTQAMLQANYALLAAYVQGRLPASIAPHAAEPPSIPAELARRFEAMLSTNVPPTFAQAGYDPRELPIEETFDALMLHFTGSADAAAGSQTPEHYVQLLKAMWLVQQLQTSQDYQNARPGYYYRRAVNQIEQELLARMRDPRLLAFDVEMLAALADEVYEIWPSRESINSISQTHARPGEHEEERLDLILQGDFTEQRVVVFRRSEHHFRIVQENIRTVNGRHTEQQICLFFNMTHDHFVPWYSLPRTSQSAHEVAISNQATGDLESYRFRSSGDLYRFQEILLGQRMVFEDNSVDFELSDGTSGTGRIQIWQEPPANRGTFDGQSSSSSLGASPTSMRSSRLGSTAGSIAPSTMFEHADGMEGGSLPLPSLLILTELQGKVAYMYIKLEQGLRIFQEHCECRLGSAGYARCKVLSLARDRLRKFPTYIRYADVDEQGYTIVSSCDLSVFRVPSHPRLKELKPKMIDNLLMTFGSPIAKDAFNLELQQRFDLRHELLRQHNEYDYAMLHSAERPENTSTWQVPKGLGLTRTASLAPTVGSLQLGDNFTDEVARGTDPPPSRARAGQRDTILATGNARLARTNTDMTIRPTAQLVTIPPPMGTQSHNATHDSRQSSTSTGFRNLFRSSRS